MSFDSLGLNADILRAVEEQGYREPTPIQRQAIPVVLAGRDLMASAQTGTGKTAGFTLPLLQRLVDKQPHAKGRRPVRALILTPTRELAAQIGENVRDYSKYLDIRSLVVFGGVSINPQMMKLRSGVDVLVATPGRLLDLEHQNAVKLDQVEILVLDEADRMLDMGFIHDIRRVLAKLPARRQNLLFSATFSDDIKGLAEKLLHNPEEVSVARRNTASEQVTQHVHFVDKKRKRELLSQMIGEGNWQQVLVFTRTKHGANHLAEQLGKDGITAAAIHGNKSQGARTRALADFKNGGIRVLVATDIAARGLDIEELPHVVNYELPNVPEDYVHRIGRTGRAAATGEALSLVCVDEHKLLRDIERVLKREVPRMAIPGYEVDPSIPAEPIVNGRQQQRGGGGRGNGGAQGQGQRRGGNSGGASSDRSSAPRRPSRPQGDGAGKPAGANGRRRPARKPASA
ncbi:MULTISPECIES: ATP-dependent RNA helicase RhlE [Buttiauxella]|jgi:ATP-dependent RNA helicase RhlE|uniref:ATP-dependent RNA helicase RhlE n=1 Tax=Buttiauxella ferragutiae ATCC 51602 TaxID=1354252 RepID=A0ABX2W304_9ENTR|nr:MULTISPECIES: ATP-dependent RNA helicase RhlE [Buttiauxella]AYN26969.1 ATP-dependent RNA helicase RhlE [Buttiauxella sp. 3AFRM03]MCE0828645.1 ATP-dependent RNA helicase RhlE [Buttiauxella ferragutiae]OAT24908.1 ATP-dependent RNA helicase [Buttiauxella ferragutiae ATCC 51602]TDN52056.1 ATP-dependent RNA helicase RhlE [Buttiauxella sp. JUb87]UNK60116.1 ATP-dependent RNA helicase RhlE [Buttiauxella ferragutiae]